MSKVALTGNASGTGTLTIAAPNTSSDYTLTLPESTGTVATEAYVDALSLGKILQVQSVIKTDTYSTTSTTAADVTGLTVSITPASSSNKILVLAQVNGSQGSAGDGIFKLLRNSTEIGSNSLTYPGFGMVSSSTPNSSFSNSILYVDSPATTSATTYKVQARVSTSGTLYVNRRSAAADLGGTSQIVVMEIAV